MLGCKGILRTCWSIFPVWGGGGCAPVEVCGAVRSAPPRSARAQGRSRAHRLRSRPRSAGACSVGSRLSGRVRGVRIGRGGLHEHPGHAATCEPLAAAGGGGLRSPDWRRFAADPARQPGAHTGAHILAPARTRAASQQRPPRRCSPAGPGSFPPASAAGADAPRCSAPARRRWLGIFSMTGQSLWDVSEANVEDGEIRINVGGFKRRLRSHTLLRFPETRLGRLLLCHSREAILELCDDYDDVQREFYFDRNPELFPYVLHFYHTGKLHVMAELCVFSFSQEIEYWGINEFFIDSCCSYSYHGRKVEPEQEKWDEQSDQESTTSSFDEILAFYNDASKFDGQPLGNFRRQLWLALDNPGYSVLSRVFSVLSILVVLGSIITMCLNSLPDFQIPDSQGNPGEDPRFEIVEHFGIAWFTFELVARFAVAPEFLKFFKNALNLIDLMSIVPFYITLVVNLVVESSPTLANLGRVAQVLRLMRIFRILKLARHSTGLRSLGATLKYSYKEVGLLLLYLSVGISIFSVVAYTIEKEENEGLATIPACWWWATVSMTTVGYGDVVPGTTAGKLTASACILAGILVVVLPITLIFNKFSHFYRRQKQLESAMRSCDFGDGMKEVPSVNLRDYYAHKVKSLMASLTNMSGSSPSELSLDDSLH
ncbi:potassium voltage-gated channel subfamily S member 2 [Nannospalax galili]|nr:potassium voltage-gated channel subfamily S member 2 [Nannospalax galili]